MNTEQGSVIKAAIYGASGYTGLEIIHTLLNHPYVKIISLASESNAGRPVQEIFPHLKKLINQNFQSLSHQDLKNNCDIVFCALPHGVSMSHIPDLMKTGAKVIDLSADFRLKDPVLYENWYKQPHKASKLLQSAIYGIPELWRKKIKPASLVANPGCYPTSIILPLAPLLANGLIKTDNIICDSKSGVSGAGRKLQESFLFSECDEDMKAYALTTHRHIPEIEQGLKNISGSQISITFTPHLIPIKRGMLSTIYADIADNVSIHDIKEAYSTQYGEEKFIRLVDEGKTPRTRDVAGTNFCDIGFYLDEHTKKVILLSAIDNLGKGAAGQAVQNMNLMFNLPEDTGLTKGAILP